MPKITGPDKNQGEIHMAILGGIAAFITFIVVCGGGGMGIYKVFFCREN